MALTGKFAADFESFYAAVQKADVSLKGFETGAGRVGTSLDKMANTLAGTRLIQDATLMSAAVDSIGGVSKLTEAELARLSAQAKEASAKMVAMGQQVPPGLQRIADATSSVTAKTTDWKTAITGVMGAIGIGFSVGAVVAFGKAVFDSASQIGDLASQLGVSTDAVQGFQFAAEQSGSSLDAVGTAIQKMNVNLAGGDKSTVAALKDAGLQFSEIRAMKPEDAFLAITDALEKISDPMEQSRLQFELLGKGSAELTAAIKDGFRGVSDSANKMSAETIANLKAAQDAWAELARNVTIVSGTLIVEIMKIPSTFKSAIDGITGSVAGFKGFVVNAFTGGVGSAIAWSAAINDASKAAATVVPSVAPIPPVIKKTAEELAAAAAAAKKYSDALAGMMAKFSGAEATVSLKMLDIAFRTLTANGKLTADGMAAISKEAMSLSAAGGKLTPALQALVIAAGDLGPGLNKSALNVKDFGRQIEVTIPPVDAFTAAMAKLAALPESTAIPKATAHLGTLVAIAPPTVAKVADVGKAIGDLSQAFAQLAQVSSGALGDLVRNIGTLVAAMDTAHKGFDAFKEGKKAFDGGSSLAGIAGMATGIMGIASSAISAGKAIYSMFFAAEGRDMVKEFSGTFGGFDALHVQLNSLGDEGERLWIALTQGVGRNNPQQAQAAIDAITKALDQQTSARESSTVTTEAEAQATIETAAEAARALDSLNERLVTNTEAWAQWSKDVTGYLQNLANAVRAMPVLAPGGTSSGGESSVSAGAPYRAPAIRAGGGSGLNITVVSQLDGREVARNQVTHLPGALVEAGI